MTPAEAAAALTLAAAFDNRTPTEAAAHAWAEALPDVPLADAREVIVAHYRSESRWVMPADVLTGTRRLRAARWASHGELIPPPPDALRDDVAGQIEWTRAYRAAVGDGHPDPAATACAATGATPDPPAIAGAPVDPARVRIPAPPRR